MTTYSEEIQKLLAEQRARIASTEHHKKLYPIVDEMEKLQHSWMWYSQNNHSLEIHLSLKKKADKTYPQFIYENLLSNPLIEEFKKPEQQKKEGKHHYYFQLATPVFGKGERPKLNVQVDYTSLCRRVVTGTESYETSEYVCE